MKSNIEKIDMKRVKEKLEAAHALLKACCGEHGMFAGSGPRYHNQY
jgi:hypothetical protein